MMNPVLLLVLGVLPYQLEAACPTGWKTFNAACYKIFPKSSWNIARVTCINNGATLAEVQSSGENDFIRDTFSKEVWIGISRCHEDSTCLPDFKPVTYENWAPGQPDKQPNNPPVLENKDFAAVIKDDGKWIDEPKDKNYPILCKKPDDPCKDNFCNPEGSTCKNGDCVCKPGYSGEYCYVRPCDAEPCKNGGDCENVGVGYKCKCVKFYSGKNCEVPPPCKTKKPCKNGAVCFNVNAVDYKCKCKTGWIGKNCDERPCDRKPCVNARQCINVGNGYRCICIKGWNGDNCEKQSNADGDPHYTTFDGRRYDFMGICEYIYAKDCGPEHAFEVLQQNEPCAGRVSCTRSIRVIFKTYEIVMQRRGVVYVNGQLTNLPWKKSGVSLSRYRGGAALSVPKLLFTVLWDGYIGITMKINQRYRGNMCGLMGNADGNPRNDFQLPNKTITTNIARFGNSWKKNPRCVNGIVPPDPCKKVSSAKLKGFIAQCNKMKAVPFKVCNSRITPDVNYIPNCLYDLCAMKSNPEAAWCQALEAYDRACKAKGVSIRWEGKPDFVKCGDPCANMPCFNGAKCENINRKAYKCTCPDGFSGRKCENVDCKRGYLSFGNACYKKMIRRPWKIARCKRGDQFVYGKTGEENTFLYKNFALKSKQPFWMNAVVCGKRKLCKNNYGIVYSHHFRGVIPGAFGSCVYMPPGGNGKWKIVPPKLCRVARPYICKHVIF